MLFHFQTLDYESKRDYEFRVEVRNTYLDARFIHGLQFKDYATVRVTVEDVDEPPVFTRNPYIIEVHEDTAAGSFVGVVSARDPDADNKPVKYATSKMCLDLVQIPFLKQALSSKLKKNRWPVKNYMGLMHYDRNLSVSELIISVLVILV